jgi:tRNA threonylcarbamoyladenosine biosynthesis protein TsaB
VLADAWHDQANAHGERLLGLIDEIFGRAERSLADLGRVAVGRGPGAFTGLRVGLALAQGIGSGLSLQAVGIGSLRAMAAGTPAHLQGNRWPLLDARRGEIFLACFAKNGSELLSPRAVPRQGLVETLMRLNSNLPGASTDSLLLGHAMSEIPELAEANLTERCGFTPYRSDSTDWPGARAVGQLASALDENAPASPEYLRDADAIMPNLPACPLNQPRQAGPGTTGPHGGSTLGSNV